MRFCLGLHLVAVVLFTSIPSQLFCLADDQARVTNYVTKHCIACHGNDKQEGQFRIDTLPLTFEDTHTIERWREVISRVGTGQMPPKEIQQPSALETQDLISWLNTQIEEGESLRSSKRSLVTHYRLSREEYSHTVYDFLGVVYDTRAPGAFSEDPTHDGFERLGSELSMSAKHMEKYLIAAEKIAELAFTSPKPQVAVREKRDALAIDWPNSRKRKLFDAAGFTPKIRTVLWPGLKLSSLQPTPSFKLEPGVYRARLQVSGIVSTDNRVPHLSLYSQELDRTLFETDVVTKEDEPKTFEFEVYLPGGSFGLEIENSVHGPSNRSRSGRAGDFVFTTIDDPKSRAPWQRKLTDDQGRALYPLLIFDFIEWEGPITKPDVLAKRTWLIPPETATDDEVKKKLISFLEQAWRRPATDEEVSRYLSFYRKHRIEGSATDEAFKVTVVAILSSRNFVYLVEGDPSFDRPKLTSWELASRLSYFLWSSLPDESLRKAAQQANLNEPEVLRQQFVRMLSDDRTQRFTESFCRQWLQLKKLGSFPPDTQLYPDYDRWLETSMRLETTNYFTEVFKNNLSIREFLDSDWTILNPRLAIHYGLPIPDSSSFQRFVLPANAHRGGLLTQASILTLTSDGTRHRPVHRGAWIMNSILGVAPPNPPANVPAIEPNPIDSPKATVRMKLDAHKQNPSCAACHARIDPLGYAFENYDAIGRWRTVEVVTDGQGEDPIVDASGVLPDGRKFRNSEEFKSLMVERLDLFARALIEKLATYALRREMTVQDAKAIDQLVLESASHDYRLRSIVEAFVLSDLFQKR